MAQDLPLVVSSLELLTGQLDARDSIAIMVYAGASGTVLPPTSGADKRTILDALERLEAGGSTNGGAGIELYLLPPLLALPLFVMALRRPRRWEI